jgi:hypothetical protein
VGGRFAASAARSLWGRWHAIADDEIARTVGSCGQRHRILVRSMDDAAVADPATHGAGFSDQ